MSSNAFDLVAAGAPVEEIRDALSPAIRGDLHVAFREISQALQPCDEHAQDEIAVALGRQIGLLKAGLRVEDKEDWIGVALGELVHLPPDLVLESLQQVRRRARFEGDVIPAVLEDVEPKVAKLHTERKHVARLVEIAG